MIRQEQDWALLLVDLWLLLEVPKTELFIAPVYNNFSKIAMESRELSYQDANRLFQSALLIISQQNLAEKQKNQKSKNQQGQSSPSLSPKSPKKIRNRESINEHLELTPLDSELNPQKSPEKTINAPALRFSSEKWGSLNEISENSPLGLSKPSQKQDLSVSLGNMKMESARELGRREIEMEAQFSLEGDMKDEKEEDLYLEGEIKQIKRDLQISSRGKICKTQEINSSTGQVVGYHFYCKNDSECSFDCYLEYANRRNSKGEKFYKLQMRSETHLNACLEDEEEIAFMKLTKTIDNMEEPIIKLLSQNGELKPKQILTSMAEKLGEENHKFIYKGLSSKNYHKAAKKYFDNLIYKVKNGMGVLPQ